jgi:V8-like Glu-specific endopeptidase
MMNVTKQRLFALSLVLSAAATPEFGAWAQTTSPAREYEEVYIREQLQGAVAQDPGAAADAQKALDALNQPETTAEGRQARNRRERGARRIVNGVPFSARAVVGALLMGSDPRTASLTCTGALIGCDKFLTAAHCIANSPSADSYLVFFQELGFFRLKSLKWEKEKYKAPYFDLAMLTLDKPVVGVAPAAINRSVKPLNKSLATIAGFGRTGGVRLDYGVKREGSVKTEACPGHWANLKVMCWRFDADVKPGASAQNTCHGDSGGGIFMRDDDGQRVVDKIFGIVSGGTDNDCMKNDLSYNVDVFEYRDWLQEAGEGRLSSAMCGKPLWDKGREPARRTFRLDDGKPEASFVVEAPEGATSLRVSMNAEDDGNGRNEFELSVAGGNGTKNRCKEDGVGPRFAYCTIDRPAAGVWTIAVKRKKGAGEVQLTALFVGP